MDLIDVGLWTLLVLVMAWMIWGVAFRRKRPAKEPVDLTLLAKEDYDFLRSNGLEVTQEIHDRFYPPFETNPGGWGSEIIRQPLDNWGDEALVLDSRMSARYAQKQADLAFEQRRGIRQQEELLSRARSEREYEELRPALIEAENAIRAKWIKPGEPKPVQIIAGNPDGKHVRISSTGVQQQQELLAESKARSEAEYEALGLAVIEVENAIRDLYNK